MDFLTTINEGDEHVSLGDVLALRDSCLSESELWAVCRECCLALQGIHLSSDIFQTLCITPDAICFDHSGTVCFLDLYIDPEPMYVPPEYEKMGNSYKSHLYSLGMTLLFAAEYNVSLAGTRQFSTELGHTINKMTLDDLESRVSLEYVLDMCDKYLGEQASDSICQLIVSVAQSDTSFEDDRLSSEVDQLLLSDDTTEDVSSVKNANTSNPLLSPASKHKHSWSSSPRKRASPVDLNDLNNVKDSLELGGSVDPFSRRMDSKKTEENHSIPRKVQKTGMVDILKKRDPLERILRTTFIEDDEYETEDGKFKTETDENGTASLEDITLLPPTSNDLDLLQWDSDFLLSSYSALGITSQVFNDDPSSNQNDRNGSEITSSGTQDLIIRQEVTEKNDHITSVELNEVEFSLDEESEHFRETEENQNDPSGVNHTRSTDCGEDNDKNKSSKMPPLPGVINYADEECVGESQLAPVIEGHNGVLSEPLGSSDVFPIESPHPKNSISEQDHLKGTTNKDISGVVLLSEKLSIENKNEKGAIATERCVANDFEESHYLKNQSLKIKEKNISEHSFTTVSLSKESSTEGSSLSNSLSLSISQGSRAEEEIPSVITSSVTTPTFQVSSDGDEVANTTLDLDQSERWEILSTPPQNEDSKTVVEILKDHNTTTTENSTETETISGVIVGEGSSVNSGQPQTTSGVGSGFIEEELSQVNPASDWSCTLESGNRADNNQNTSFTEGSLSEKQEQNQIHHNNKTTGLDSPVKEEITKINKCSTEQSSASGTCENVGTPGSIICDTEESFNVDTSLDTTSNNQESEQLQPTAASDVVTIKFNAVFGKRIHRDTSRDTLNQDIVDSCDTVEVDNSVASLKAENEGVASSSVESILINGDFNAQNGPVVDSGKAFDSMDKPGSRRKDTVSSGSSEGGQSVLEILDRLGCGFHENEVWALCRECVLAMQRNRLHLPAYVSLETVTLEDSGRVTYRPVPEDKELEVVFLAPELQKFGVITEKTCLFGVAAMLWSAADYRLPANQEPALSEELENLLISMTQDDNDLRPTAIEVLQTCNEYQKKQTTTSTQICQALVKDAKKALDYGKGNSLVKHLLEQQIENEVKSHKAEVVKVIQGQPAVTLKPASERTERPQVESEPTLHEKLMALIRAPPRKLRRSSKPRIQTVGEIYLTNPELLPALKRATGVDQNQEAELVPSTSTKDSAPLDVNQKQEVDLVLPKTGTDSAHSTTSAFSSVSNTAATSVSDSLSSTTTSVPIPEAFNSKATHFSPIVLSGEHEKKTAKTQQSGKSSKTGIDEKEMAEKIKKLKKNLMKNRLPLTLAADLESEVMSQDTKPKVKAKSVTPTHQAVAGHQGQLRLPTPPNVYHLASPHSVATAEGYNPAVLNAITPTSVHQQSMGYHNLQTSPSAAASNMPQVQGQFLPHHALQQTQLMSTSVPNLAYQYAAPMAFQMGLQQDPQTGLFQLVPVPTPMPLPSVQIQPGMQATATSMGQINLVPQMQNLGQLNVVASPTGSGGSSGHHSHHQVFSPGLESSKQISTPSGSSTDGERPERKRHRKRQLKVKERSKPQSERESSSKLKSRTKGQSSSSRKEDSDERETDGHYGSSNNKGSDLSPVLELRAPVPRASSVDLIEKYENGNNAQPRTPRTVKMRDQRNKLIKRTKSGSSLDFKNSNSELKAFDIYDDNKNECKKLMASNLSRSQPNLESFELSEFSMPMDNAAIRGPSHHSTKKIKPRSQRRKTDPASPELPSPPLSPSLSKDSGVSGMNVKTSDMSLMERLLNSDTIRHQQRLSRVVRIVRDEFAYDGYMENGIEDLAMAEYILSLVNLKWETFYSAVTEKYCDLYFEEDVVSSLYEAVNGKKPLAAAADKRASPLAEKFAGNNVMTQDTGRVQSRARDNTTSSSTAAGGLPHDSNSPSAFRPIYTDTNSKSHTPPVQQPETIIKPTPTKPQSSAISTRQISGVQNLDKTRSSSLRNLLIEDGQTIRESSRTRWHSDEDLLDHENDSAKFVGGHFPLTKQQQKPSETPSEVVHSSNNGMGNTDTINQKNQEKSEINMDLKHMSKLSYLVRQDSEANDYSRKAANLKRRISKNGRSMLQSKSALEVRANQQQQVLISSSEVSRRDETESPLISISQLSTSMHSDLREEGAVSKLNRNVYESETQLSTASGGSEGDKREARLSVPKPYADMTRLGRGSVVYYSAEMQNRLRPDVKDFAAQIDARTKENIESKMAELEQQMMMEHRNKKKTLKYYRKLVETTKVGKISTEQRALLTRVGEQVAESNDRLDFLDAAKKHLEMLHAEQWGLERTMLYALANCPGDSAMLLCACDNPLLQYQLLRSPRLGIEGQILQAGSPHGLLSYLFSQVALSEGFIHQFFYCFRYFTTPEQVFHFLCEKFTAAALSLAPGADIPSKVKARSMDLMQVWIEGFYTVDFKDSYLMDDFSNFVQEKVLAVDDSAELIIEVIDSCRAGRHRDLFYPEFSAREDTNNNNNGMEEMPIKKEPQDNNNQWESFKAAFTGKSPKSKGNLTMVKDGKKPGMEGIRRSDAFNVMDYTAQNLAEQLTLMEQALFQQSHPVHYLNSKYQGVTVSLTNPVLHKADSMQRLSSGLSVGESSNLFAGEAVNSTIIHRLIEHAQTLAFWVAAEIVSCPNSKSQSSVLSKFIYIAKYCQEVRNFATCIAIVDGLENLIVRQLPVWKALPSKCVTLMGELSSLKVLLKSDSVCLLQDKTKRQAPTIPSILYFLLHVQQLEIGGFTLANKMFRWVKLKSIASMIDQIRMFQQNQYGYNVDIDLQTALRTHMAALSTQDLPMLAQHATNIPKAPSAGKLSLAFKKMSRKMKGGAES